MPSVHLAIVLTLFAGMMNGSFPLPTKHARHWKFEHIWLNFGFWGFLFLPWLTVFALDPHAGQIYQVLPSYTWFILLTGGFLFGIGLACFSRCLEYIGFGLGFTINLGIGTALGLLVPLAVLHTEDLFNPADFALYAALLFILAGLYLSYRAGKKRDQQLQSSSKRGCYSLGIFLAMIAGICSAIQNFSFAFTSNVQQLAMVLGANSLSASIIIWPPFLSVTFISYASYMLYLHARHNSFDIYLQPHFKRHLFFTLLMGVLWFGSIVAYSQAALWIGALGPEIAWPLFMVAIILTSSFWGWRYKEWRGCDARVRRLAILSIVALVIAVVILAFVAGLSVKST